VQIERCVDNSKSSNSSPLISLGDLRIAAERYASASDGKPRSYKLSHPSQSNLSKSLYFKPSFHLDKKSVNGTGPHPRPPYVSFHDNIGSMLAVSWSWVGRSIQLFHRLRSRHLLEFPTRFRCEQSNTNVHESKDILSRQRHRKRPQRNQHLTMEPAAGGEPDIKFISPNDTGNSQFI
jgi:hypothetical protein